MFKQLPLIKIILQVLLPVFGIFGNVDGQMTPSELDESLKAGIDPYFVETLDTFSTHGPQCIVRDVLQDKGGNIWLATWSGIIRFDGNLFMNYTLKERLIHFHVLSLFEDSKGNIWFGTARGGAYRYDGYSFKLFTKADGLVDNTIFSFAEDNSGNIWFATEKGASFFDGKSFINFTTQNGLSNNYVNAVLRDRTGRIWLGTNDGIDCYDSQKSGGGILTKQTGNFSKFTDENKLPFKKVTSLFEDKAGVIWIGSEAKQAGGKGLCCYNGKTVCSSITPYFVMYMCEDKKGNLLFAHNKGAVDVNFALYSYDGKSIAKITEQHNRDNPMIFGITEDKIGNIWFGTFKGVCRYDRKNFTYFNDDKK